MMSIDVAQLDQVAPLDGLVYGFEFDSRRVELTLSIGVDAKYHSQAAQVLGIEGHDEVVVDFVLGGARAVHLKGAFPTRGTTTSDEPPHDFEIASWRAERRTFGRTGQLEIRCHSGQKMSFEFDTVRFAISQRPVGRRYDNESPLGPGVTVQRPRSE